MNLAWHQFRKDVRQFRVFLGIWGGLVLLDLAVNLGWIGRVIFRPPGGFDQVSNTWTGLLPTVLWVLVGLLPSLVVLTDSPARREGFLATRPLPKRDWLLAKLVFVLGLVVAPWTLQELAHLALEQMPGWVIAQGTVERLMFTLPVAVGFGAYAALWAGYARWARALAGSVVGLYLVLLGVMAVSWILFHSRTVPFIYGSTNGLWGAYALAFALVLLAMWHARVHPGAQGRWGGLLLAALCYELAGKLCPSDLLALRPADPVTAKSTIAETGFEVPRRGIQFLKQVDPQQPGQGKFTVSLTPRTKPLPPGLAVEWSAKDVGLMHTNGGTIPGGVHGDRTPFFVVQYWNPVYLANDYAAWAAAMSEDVLFRPEQHHPMGVQYPTATAGPFDMPDSNAEMSVPLTLKANLEARVFRWRKVADLSLTSGAKSTDDFGSWEFVAAMSPGTPLGTHLYVHRRQIELSTSRDSRCSTAQDGPLVRMVFMVYDPQRQIAWLPQPAINAARRANHTALVQHFVALYLNNRKPFTPEELARCRLVVFEKTWLGSVPEQWQSPTFTLAEMLPVGWQGATPINERIPRAEFRRRLAALTAPEPDAPRREVSLYLLEFLRLVDAHGQPLGPTDPQTALLARFVPTHLDVLLEGLPVMNWTAKRSVLWAIQIGAAEAQKPAIIAALSHEPELAEVLFTRGWVEDARAEILHLADRSRSQPLPPAAFRAVAWFRNPQTYPRLLEESEACQGWQFDILRTLPGLEASLGEIVRRHWREDSRLWNDFESWTSESFQLALRQGEASALRYVFHVLEDPDFNPSSGGWNFAEALRSGIQLSGLAPEKRHDYEVVLAWMRTHHPGDFVFDPARRQFVLKETLAAAQRP